MNSRWLVLLGIGASLGALEAVVYAAAEDPFAAGVRSTDPVTAAEQQKTFQVPPGFEVQLVAAEPDINKPMNLAFDGRGRLWVTTSIEYPFAAPTNRVGRDRVMVFSDFGADGRARKVSEFAGGLNIPIGIYPLTGIPRRLVVGGDDTTPFGDACLVWSIPHIWLMEDGDGDGKAERRTPWYGPFDHTRDTHGNQASFRRGFDGWLYATHGFNNDSHVKGRDGNEVHLNSGNTYRVRLDGSRIEHHTWGQVNPFGMAWDAVGNLYSSDCHSAPTYQLLAGGYYPSFGKPHDGLGFAPVLMEHSHGSTAIDAMFYYADDRWPEEFKDNIFVGNVMTSRMNRDRLEFHGSSPQAIEQDDFVKSTDPWFRPVDSTLGPDGAMYIADFYNRIIGHYEVPLKHPGRDRERGRIWRVVYRGGEGRSGMHERKLDLTRAKAAELVEELADPNLTWRMLALNQLVDREGREALPWLGRVLKTRGAPAAQRAHALWALVRITGDLDARVAGRLVEDYLEAAATDPERLVRTHAMRITAELPKLGDLRPAVDRALRDRDALVQRCAAEALGRHPEWSGLRGLLALRSTVPERDTHLMYVVRKALRDHLREPTLFDRVLAEKWSEAEERVLADVAVAVSSPPAGTFLLGSLERLTYDRETTAAGLRHAARWTPASELGRLATLAEAKFGADMELQASLFVAVEQGLEQRGTPLPDTVKAWGGRLAGRLLASIDAASIGWSNQPLEGKPAENPWGFQTRPTSDGDPALRVLSSIVHGEQRTGVLRSPEFEVPARLSFWLSGHDGFPDKPAQKKNRVRLREAATGEVLAEAWPPRNDTAQPVRWDLSAQAGKRAYLEVMDGDDGAAYAWLAVGRFEPAVVSLPQLAPEETSRRQRGACELAAKLGLRDLGEAVRGLATQSGGDSEVRIAASRALAALDRMGAVPVIAPLLERAGEPMAVREAAGQILAGLGEATGPEAVATAMKSAPLRLQVKWAQALAASPVGASALLRVVGDGQAAAQVLLDRTVRDRLLAARPGDAGRVEELTRGLAPLDEGREKLMAERRAGFVGFRADAAAGLRVFQQNCAACHRIGTEGGLVGPQLDGVGNRGLERLCEDVIDPNRNVDRAFRSHVLTMKDGDIISGLPRREEGEVLVLADSTGKEIRVSKQEVTARHESETSLMPENFGELLSAEDFNQLMAWLLSQRGPIGGPSSTRP